MKLSVQRWLGKLSHPNQLDLPKGALAEASNCALVRPGLLTPRNGLSLHSTDSTYDNTRRMWEWDGVKFRYADDGAGAFRISWYNGSTWAVVGSQILDADGANFPLHHVETPDAMFVAESTGIRRYESSSATSGYAGVPWMPDMDRSNSTLTDNAAGILEPEAARAYRAVLEQRPTDGTRYRIGAPSGRLVLRNENAGGGSNQIPVVRVLLPKAVNTRTTALTVGNLWLSLYASAVTPAGVTDPGEDYGLIYDYLLTSADITAGYVDITDVDAIGGGSALYTNETDQEGEQQACHPPPFVRCLTPYKGCLVGANYTTRHVFELHILGVGGSAGIQDTDTMTFEYGADDFTVTAKTTPTTADHYAIEDTGSVTQDVELTAQNLVAAINRHTDNDFVYATYAGVPGDVRSVGRILVWHRLVDTTGANHFSVYVGTGDQTECFEPQLPAGATSSAVQSRADRVPNGWVLSKRDQPDAWPLLQHGEMGNGNVIAVASLDEAVFFFHDSGEVWRGSGEPPLPNNPGTWRVERWWTNLTLLAPQTIQELDGWLWMLTDRGVIRTDGQGYEVMSGPIETELKADVLSSGSTNVRQRAYAVVDPVTRRYLLALYVSSEYLFHVWHAEAEAWTAYVVNEEDYYSEFGAGMWSVEDDALYFGTRDGSSSTIYSDSNGAGDEAFDDEGRDITASITLPPFVHGDGTTPKQLREVQLVFEGAQPASLTATVTTEHGNDSVTVATQSTNLCRIPVPQSVQRGARHTLSLSIAAQSQWKLAGCAFLYRPYAERANK